MSTSIETAVSANPRLVRLRKFVNDFSSLIAQSPAEAQILLEGSVLLRSLVATDDWLPEAYAKPSADLYSQYLLHVDGQERFSIVSFVWGPGQASPIHDHTTWGIIGILRGKEIEQRYVRQPDRSLTPDGEAHTLLPGAVETLSPSTGDLHQVSNGFSDRSSVSIHVYGGNIGAIKRSTYGLSGTPRTFISGYSNRELPNFWDAI
jgi:predicted metal-dependent enzyme (double-stranded beta helix superfamily)